MFFPNATTPTEVAQMFCVSFSPAGDPLDTLYQQAAVQFNSDNDPSLAAWIYVSLYARMMLYRKSSCTDCAEGQQVQTNLAGALNTENIIGGVIGGANSALGTAAQFSEGLTKALPIIGDIENIIGSIVNVFGAAHAAAVAKEQAVNCAAATQFNQYMPQVDAAVANGQIDAATGISTAQRLIQTISDNLNSVVKAHNIGWGMQQVLQAQLWFRQQWYPSLEGSAGGFGLASNSKSGLLLIGAVIVGAMLLSSKSV